MENQPKGTVTPLASTFPIEEAQKAARRVEESLEEPRKEIQKLKEFIDDNRKLMKLVQKLPDELSHNIMVPFGKAAFFPGRMIHTNELLFRFYWVGDTMQSAQQNKLWMFYVDVPKFWNPKLRV